MMKYDCYSYHPADTVGSLDVLNKKFDWHRRAKLLLKHSRYFLLILLTILVSCGNGIIYADQKSPNLNTALTSPTTPVLSRLQLIAQFPSEELHVGEMVLLKVIVKNNTKETIYLPETDTAENEFNISVTDVEGHPVPLTLWGKTYKTRSGTHDVNMLSSRMIAPEKHITYQFLLNRHFDMTLGGRFSVVVARDNIPDKDEKGVMRLVSNRASIMLVEPDPEVTSPEDVIRR